MTGALNEGIIRLLNYVCGLLIYVLIFDGGLCVYTSSDVRHLNDGKRPGIP